MNIGFILLIILSSLIVILLFHKPKPKYGKGTDTSICGATEIRTFTKINNLLEK